MISLDSVYVSLLESITARRLVIFAGAGLSFAAPSNVPTASNLARACAAKHASATGETIDPAVTGDLEALATLFYDRARLENYFLTTLVEWDRFLGEPNAGHACVADLLLCDALEMSVTTNFDALVEIAAARLGARGFQGALTGSEAQVAQKHRPLLKLHGCARRDKMRTLWTSKQLVEPAWTTRVDEVKTWLTGHLTQRDIVFVGYWTDWGYLNEVLEGVLADNVPRSVTLVDPESEHVLATKADGLWQWSHRGGITFTHVQMSGEVFLEGLRRRVSERLLTQIVEAGQKAFADDHGSPPVVSFDGLSTDELYALRRDWTGVRRDQPVRRRSAEPSDELIGKTILEFFYRGASMSAANMNINGKRVRLVQAAGRMLYSVRSEFESDAGVADAPDVTVCVGAEDDGGVPPHLVRASAAPTVIRPGSSGTWCTHKDVRSVLGL